MGPCTGLGHAEADSEPTRPSLPIDVLDILKCQAVLKFTRSEMLHTAVSRF